MFKTNGTAALAITKPHSLSVLMLFLAGCVSSSDPVDRPTDTVSTIDLARYIEIERAGRDQGLPCKVIDRQADTGKTVLWRAEFEEGFCERKADETRYILESRGWACSEHLPAKQGKGHTDTPYLAMSWRCFEGASPAEQIANPGPPLPAARPVVKQVPSDLEAEQILAENKTAPPAETQDQAALETAVAEDLEAIGEDVIGEKAKVETVRGDLDGDSAEDAVVVLTRGSGTTRASHMLMAYLKEDSGYSLVDVWIPRAAEVEAGRNLELAIHDGTVEYTNCCDGQPEPTVLVLKNRKFVYADLKSEP